MRSQLSKIRPHLIAFAILTLLLSTASAENPACVQSSNQELIIYRAGSLTRAIKPIEELFTCRTGIQVRDFPMGSVDAGRQITAGAKPADLYAPADYLDIDLFFKPAGYADFDIVFAQGKMVLAYSASAVAEKKLPSITESESVQFRPPDSVPKANPRWYEILTTPGISIGGGNPFLDPGAYRANMIFQLAEDYYKVPNLYNNLLQHIVNPGGDHSAPALGRKYEFQFIYEHSAQLMASSNPDVRYVALPDEINLSDANRNAYYREHAVVVLPGLGTANSARSIAVPASRVAWGITVLNSARNRENAIRFLELLLGPEGAASLKANGPQPISPALVNKEDMRKLPKALIPFVKQAD